MTARATSVIALAAALAVVLPGCGDSEADRLRKPTPARQAPRTTPPERVQDLLRRIPGDTDRLTVMDWQRARAELGVDARVDPADPAVDSRVEYRFEEAARSSADHLRSPGGFDHIPAEKAIDHRRVMSAASAGQATGNPVVLLATSEPRPAIARSMRRAGYRRTRAGLYVHRDADDIPYGIAGIGDRLVVFGERRDEVSSALVRRRPTRTVKRLLGLLDRVEGARRFVRSYYLPSAESACVRAVAASEDYRDNADDFAIQVSGRAGAERVKLGRTLPEDPSRARLQRIYKTSNIRADGDTVQMTVTIDGDPNFPNHVIDMDLDEAADVYSCS